MIANQLGVAPEKVTLTASFTHDLGADSTAVMELDLALEQAFNVQIPDDAWSGADTLQQAVAVIQAQLHR